MGTEGTKDDLGKTPLLYDIITGISLLLSDGSFPINSIEAPESPNKEESQAQVSGDRDANFNRRARPSDPNSLHSIEEGDDVVSMVMETQELGIMVPAK